MRLGKALLIGVVGIGAGLLLAAWTETLESESDESVEAETDESLKEQPEAN